MFRYLQSDYCFFFFLTFHTIVAAARVEVGTETFTKASAKPLTKGNGERKVTTSVTFQKEFDKVPEVLTFLSMQDVMKGNTVFFPP